MVSPTKTTETAAAVPKKTTDVADLEDEDYFEEFDLDMPQSEKMDTDAAENDDDEDEIYGEAEKWDDDDIEEDFSSTLKQELKIEDKADDLDIDAIYKQEIAAREAKRQKKADRTEALAKKEIELLIQEKELEQRKKIYANYTLDASLVTASKTGSTKKSGKTELDTFFSNLATGLEAVEVKADEFADDLKPIIRKNKNLPLSVQRDNLSDKETDLKRKEKYLQNEYVRFLKHRNVQAAKLLPATATAEAVTEREKEETLKVMQTTQTKRRRASLVLMQDKAAHMDDAKKEDLERTVLVHAQEIAAVELLEETVLLGQEGASRTATAVPKKCLPYKPAKGDDIDAAVGKELTSAKLDCGIKLAATTAANTREYILEDGQVIKVKVVHKIVLANDGEAWQWSPLIQFLNTRLNK